MKTINIQIPDGFKSVISEAGNLITVFLEPNVYVPQKGDFVKVPFNDNFAYFECGENGKFIPAGEEFLTNVVKGILHIAEIYGEELGYEHDKANKIPREKVAEELAKHGFTYDFDTKTYGKVKFKPENKERYFFVDAANTIQSSTFYSNCAPDNQRIDFGNCYKTESDAKNRQEWNAKFKD